VEGVLRGTFRASWKKPGCARGAHPIAELRRDGASSDAHHVTAMEPSGRALEAAAIRSLFGACCDRGLRVSSTKSLHGHLIGAARRHPPGLRPVARDASRRLRAWRDCLADPERWTQHPGAIKTVSWFCVIARRPPEQLAVRAVQA